MQEMHDLANYLELSRPFENPEAAEKALNEFYSAVSALRRTYRLPDVHVIVQVNIRHEEEIGRGLSSAHFGNSAEAVVMCAWSYANECKEQRKLVGG